MSTCGHSDSDSTSCCDSRPGGPSPPALKLDRYISCIWSNDQPTQTARTQPNIDQVARRGPPVRRDVHAHVRTNSGMAAGGRPTCRLSRDQPKPHAGLRVDTHASLRLRPVRLAWGPGLPSVHVHPPLALPILLVPAWPVLVLTDHAWGTAFAAVNTRSEGQRASGMHRARVTSAPT